MSAISLYLIFFALANEAWVVISTPAAPWRPQGPTPIFEARLWAIIFGAFFAGAATIGILWILSARKRARLSKRVKRLERELDQTKKLLAVSTRRANPGARLP